jgi:hypothetical protein
MTAIITAAQLDAVGFSTGTSGTLVSREARNAQVAFGGIVADARIAFGCVAQPEPSDRVLLATADDTLWIIAVLERATAAPLRLFAEGDIAVVSANGNVAVAAAHEVTLDAGARARVSAREIDLHAGIARLVLDEVLHVGRRITAHATKLRCVSDMIESIAEHVLTRARRSSRFIDETDHVRAEEIDHRATGTLQLRAKTAFVTADNVVRVDADQIHMG